jgi:signal transduction histidine kinase
MKRQFGKLPKAEQERIELEYHHTDPHEFDEEMSRAKTHAVESIRLSRRMVQSLKAVAESEGESGYEGMVKKWIKERLRQEVSKRGPTQTV